MPIKPNTKIVQTHFSGQTSLNASQIMWSFPYQAKGIQPFVIDFFDDLSQTRQPAMQWFGPMKLPAALRKVGIQVYHQLAPYMLLFFQTPFNEGSAGFTPVRYVLLGKGFLLHTA